jgi:hypothetical protein
VFRDIRGELVLPKRRGLPTSTAGSRRTGRTRTRRSRIFITSSGSHGMKNSLKIRCSTKGTFKVFGFSPHSVRNLKGFTTPVTVIIVKGH